MPLIVQSRRRDCIAGVPVPQYPGVEPLSLPFLAVASQPAVFCIWHHLAHLLHAVPEHAPAAMQQWLPDPAAARMLSVKPFACPSPRTELEPVFLDL